jgi:hypothetical protein
VLERAGNDKHNFAMWLCRCTCGNTKVISGGSLRGEKTRSCGCLQKERASETQSLPEGTAAFNKLLYRYKHAAKRRGYVWELAREQFREIVIKPCVYCGSFRETIFKDKYYNGGFPYTGIDRVDNDQGYTYDNIVPCCGTCNYMKKNLSVEFFISHITKILENYNAHSRKRRTKRQIYVSMY